MFCWFFARILLMKMDIQFLGSSISLRVLESLSLSLMLLLFLLALHAVLLLEFEVLLPEGVDAVNHALHELHLGVAEAVLVRDVVGVTSLAAGLSPGAPGLHLELLAPLLEGAHAAVALLGPAGQVNVHGGTHAGAQVGGAGVDVAELG